MARRELGKSASVIYHSPLAFFFPLQRGEAERRQTADPASVLWSHIAAATENRSETAEKIRKDVFYLSNASLVQ